MNLRTGAGNHAHNRAGRHACAAAAWRWVAGRDSLLGGGTRLSQNILRRFYVRCAGIQEAGRYNRQRKNQKLVHILTPFSLHRHWCSSTVIINAVFSYLLQLVQNQSYKEEILFLYYSAYLKFLPLVHYY